MLRMVGDQLGRGVREIAPRVMLEMPVGRDDLAQERIERLTLGDETLVEEPGVPIVQNPADVEDDGRGSRLAQPWRALKRRFVLLMT